MIVGLSPGSNLKKAEVPPAVCLNATVDHISERPSGHTVCVLPADSGRVGWLLYNYGALKRFSN